MQASFHLDFNIFDAFLVECSLQLLIGHGGGWRWAKRFCGTFTALCWYFDNTSESHGEVGLDGRVDMPPRISVMDQLGVLASLRIATLNVACEVQGAAAGWAQESLGEDGQAVADKRHESCMQASSPQDLAVMTPFHGVQGAAAD